MGWEKLTSGCLEICQLPVFPAAMLVEPFVQLLAEKLQAYINEAIDFKPAKIQFKSKGNHRKIAKLFSGGDGHRDDVRRIAE